MTPRATSRRIENRRAENQQATPGAQPEEERPGKKLRRKFHGARRNDEKTSERPAKADRRAACSPTAKGGLCRSSALVSRRRANRRHANRQHANLAERRSAKAAGTAAALRRIALPGRVRGIRGAGRYALWWSMILSENQLPPRIKSAACFFRISSDARRRRTAARPRARRPEIARRSGRPRIVCANRCSTFSRTASTIRSPAPACSISLPAPARWASKRSRAAPRSCCSSTRARRRARCCARTSPRSVLAAPRGFFAATRPNSATRIRYAPFSLAFLDPPYGQGLATAALASARAGGWFTPDALIVVEEAAKAQFAAPEGFREVDRRRYDDTEFIFLRMSENQSALV